MMRRGMTQDLNRILLMNGAMIELMLGVSKLLTGLVVGYLAATISESTLHRVFGHAGIRERNRWRFIPLMYRLVNKVHYGHAVVHHAKTYRKNHVTQFRNLDEQDRVNCDLRERGYEIYIRSRYGLVTDKLGVLCFVAPPIVICSAVSYIAFGTLSPLFLLSAAIPIAAAPLLSYCVHPFLHLPIRDALRGAPPFTTWILSSRYGRWARISHYVHHKHPQCNFNLLFGADYLLGYYRSATENELQEMREIGLLLELDWAKTMHLRSSRADEA